jgi:hypothetical protein
MLENLRSFVLCRPKETVRKKLSERNCLKETVRRNAGFNCCVCSHNEIRLCFALSYAGYARYAILRVVYAFISLSLFLSFFLLTEPLQIVLLASEVSFPKPSSTIQCATTPQRFHPSFANSLLNSLPFPTVHLTQLAQLG